MIYTIFCLPAMTDTFSAGNIKYRSMLRIDYMPRVWIRPACLCSIQAILFSVELASLMLLLTDMMFEAVSKICIDEVFKLAVTSCCLTAICFFECVSSFLLCEFHVIMCVYTLIFTRIRWLGIACIYIRRQIVWICLVEFSGRIHGWLSVCFHLKRKIKLY